MPSVPAGLESSCNLVKTDRSSRPGQLQGATVKHVHYGLALCIPREPMDRNRLGQCAELANRTECKRYREASTKVMES
jgi:hypothetical protein